MAKKKKTKRTIALPGLGDVDAFSTLPEGEYHVEVTDVEQKEGNEYDYLNWELTVKSGKNKGSKVWNITSFSPKSLWNLKLWLEALEYDVPDEPEDIEVDDLIGLECMVTVTHEEYEGKARARVTDFAVVSDDGEDVEVEDDDEEDDDKYTAEAIQDMDEDELADLVKKHSLDVNLKKLKSTKKKQNAVIAALDDEDMIEEDED